MRGDLEHQSGRDSAATEGTPAHDSSNPLSPPPHLKPWEDRTAKPEDRLQAYKDFVAQQLDRIKDGLLRLDGDVARQREIEYAPETRRWVSEGMSLRELSAQKFCERVDRPVVTKDLLGRNFLGAEAWSSRGFDVGEAPPIPETLTRELLESACPLHPRELIKDTHLLVLVPKAVNGEPYSALRLTELLVTKDGSGNSLMYEGTATAIHWKTLPWASIPRSESEWVLIPKSDPDPLKVPASKHFRVKDIAAQQKVHDAHYKEHYREVHAIELITAVLLNDLVHGGPRMLAGNNYLRCVEITEVGMRICVGSFNSKLWVVAGNDGGPLASIGLGLARKF